jgi:hypothetical protein
MKKIFTLGLLALSAGAYSQPHVFTYATAPKNHVGIDTVYGTVLGTVPPTNDAHFALWDLSALVIANYEYYAVFAAETGFANATHSNLAYVDIAPGKKYQTKLMFAVKNDGIKTYGERIPAQSFSLAAETGNAGDKIDIPEQDVVYSAPQVQLPYPVTIYDKWSSTSNSATDIKVTVSPLYNNANGQRKSIITSNNEVVGWGSIRVKRLDGKSSGTKPVLQVKTTLSTKDSLFINGSPVSQMILDQVGLQQGETRIVYQTSFYREYEMLPIVNVTYSDATFTTREDVNVHAQRLPYPDGIDDIEGAVIAEIYPNPNNGAFSVRVDEAIGKWSYTVADMTGRVVANGSLDFNGRQANVSLNGAVTAGNYIVTVQQDGVAVSGLKMTIQ